ncbi:MAG: PAS domain-containing sensor histidine kinase [Patescibacteria group bacterium]
MDIERVLVFLTDPVGAGIVVGIVFFVCLIVWLAVRSNRKEEWGVTTLKSDFDAAAQRISDAERIGRFGSFSWDFQTHMVFWSDGMYELFGVMYRKRAPTVFEMLSHIHESDREAARTAWQKVQERPGDLDISFRVLIPGGAVRYIRAKGKSSLGSGSQVRLLQGVVYDVTREVAVDRAKTEFVSLASHQLKTPLTSIKWLTEALLTGQVGSLTPDQTKYVSDIQQSNHHMLEMVNELLDVSRIELRSIITTPEECIITEVAESVIHEQQQTIDVKHLVFKYTAANDLPVLQANRRLLRMVLQNLLSNALKYTPEGGHVEIEIGHGGVRVPGIFVRVADGGIGIPKDEQDNIFKRLYRAKNAQKAVADGTGLGLYVVKTVVERAGGAITFESVEGKGTTFYLTLPTVWRVVDEDQLSGMVH